MSLRGLLTEQIVIVHSAFDAVDAYGDPQPGSETRTTWLARVEALSSDELIRDRDTVVADFRAYLPPEAVVTPFDRLEAGGKSFEVWGDPVEQRTPRGRHHVLLRLRRVS